VERKGLRRRFLQIYLRWSGLRTLNLRYQTAYLSLRFMWEIATSAASFHARPNVALGADFRPET
jgi:hypothetical protein